MAWQTPKTNWQAADVVSKDDFNRIEGNVQELQDTKETPAGAQVKANAALNSAKAYTDQEVGEVAQELAAHLAQNASQHGDLSTLKTSQKSSLVEAINELFTSVSDGKTEIATAITDVDPTKTPSGSDTFSQLATAIRGISTGKKWASGSQSFTIDNERISVRGLDFRPGVIVLSWYNFGYGTYRAIYSYSPSIPYKILRDDDYVYSNKNLSLFDDGFEAEMLFSGTDSSRTASWLAIE